MDNYMLRPVGYIRSDYKEKFGIPKQCGLVDELEQAVVFEPEFCNMDCLRDIEKFEYIWIIWGFSRSRRDAGTGEAVWSPTVRPPRLGGNRRVGVWASRSPYRPNALGLSSVRFLRIELDGKEVRSDEISGPVNGELALIISGGDMMNGTPVYDIKPYLPYTDAHPEALNGFSDDSAAVLSAQLMAPRAASKADASRRKSLFMAIIPLVSGQIYIKRTNVA